jgi:hypothetical protein
MWRRTEDGIGEEMMMTTHLNWVGGRRVCCCGVRGLATELLHPVVHVPLTVTTTTTTTTSNNNLPLPPFSPCRENLHLDLHLHLHHSVTLVMMMVSSSSEAADNLETSCLLLAYVYRACRPSRLQNVSRFDNPQCHSNNTAKDDYFIIMNTYLQID